jgi:NADPH:quinone reductase-like Zn-dependent oxidoreductase
VDRERPTTEVSTVKAIVQEKYGEAEDVLRLEEIDRPDIGVRDVLLRVHAAGLDRGVWHSMAGLPYPIRLAGYGVRAPKNAVLGTDVAGRIEAVGDAVTNLQVGDEVYGVGHGSFADYTRAAAVKLARKPRNLSFEQAAALPVSGCTALQALRDRGRVQAGQRVLVIGASGGVGTYVVQIAKAFGAVVTGVCSTAKLDLVRSLGADHVIDYTADDFADGGEHYDVILDIGGNAALGRLRRALTPRGTLVIVGGETGGRWLGGTDRQLRAVGLSPFIGQKLGSFIASPNAADLTVLTELVETGQVTPVIDKTYPLREVAAAIRYMQAGHARGKVVISIDRTEGRPGG